MKRLFAEISSFSAAVKKNGISDSSIRNVQNDIMTGLGVTERNTGGIKKIRMDTDSGGKSGGWRVIYADYPEYGVTILIALFPKNKKASLSDSERAQLKSLKQLLDKQVKMKYAKEE